MHRLTTVLLISSLSFFTASCTKTKPATSIPETTIPIELFATHAIELERPVSALTFVSNDVASWLGQIIIRNADGKLMSVGIEGNAPKDIGSSKYKDVFGLSRVKSAGIFLAINESNTLEVFIESDDEGNFSAMTYSGEQIKAEQFCTTASPSAGSARVLTTDGAILTLRFSIEKNVVEQSIEATILHDVKPTACTYTGEDLYQDTNTSLIINEKPKFLTTINDRIILTDAEANPKEGYDLTIKDGLSIGGLDKTSFITVTSNSYGGASFKDGLVAMVDADNPKRIVFVSLDYMSREIAKLTTD